jgi:hypothetical protein
MPAKVYKNLIDGEWVESRTGKTFENLNPADTRDIVGIFQASGKQDVDDAVAAAKTAFEKWRLILRHFAANSWMTCAKASFLCLDTRPPDKRHGNACHVTVSLAFSAS